MYTALPIGELLIQKELISERDLSQALAMQAEVGGLLGQALQRLGAVTEEALLETLAGQLELDVANPAMLPESPNEYANAAKALGLPLTWFLARRAVAWFAAEPDGAAVLKVLAADPLNPELRERIERQTARLNRNEDASSSDAGPSGPGKTPVRIDYLLAQNQLIDMCLSRIERNAGAGDEDDEFADTARLREMAEEAPVIDFVNNMLAAALKEKASDIHLEAFEHSFAVRYRIDGVLHTRQTQSRARFDAVASRIKLIAGMDIAERRLPQDGRHSVRFAGNDIDLRISSVPSTWGESLVMRLLRKQTELPDLEGLGLTGRTGALLSEILKSPNGVMLVTGPTGSGKSTTLYRGLESIDDGYRKIITIEDPVEYDIEGVTQIQVKQDIGYDFANGLRAILRQDPDVIMVGEIRDGETARIAVQAALTGHFVLSTLHTNSALAAVTRLEDIGLEPFLIGASVRGLMAQRLVRRICDDCAVEYDGGEGDALLRQAIAEGAPIAPPERLRWRRAVGCDRCEGTGYRGRVAVAEIVKLDDALREAIVGGASAQSLFSIARKQGFITLFEDGLYKAAEGRTTLEEVHRVCGAET
ncbi:MAG: ATPase, T2SS/T4P/T4SS family [Pseudomonadota bacterium]